jgi:hypothetical protein
MRNSVVIDTASGQALIGSILVPVRETGNHGELQVAGPSGPILRPLTFGERTRLVTRAAVLPAALDSLCAGVLQAAIMQQGQAEHIVQEILALTLAGAEQEAPSFAETALRVARAAGWELSQLFAAEAAEVDRLAIYLGGHLQDFGWTRVIFGRSEDTLESIRQELGERLLQRAASYGEAIEAKGQATGRFEAGQSHSSGGGQAAERSFGLGQVAASGQQVPQPATSPSSPTSDNSTASLSTPKPGHMRLRMPAATFEQSAGRRSTPAVSTHGSPTDMPSIRWAMFPSRSGHGIPASAAPTSPGKAPAGPTAAAETTTSARPALQPAPLQLLRFNPYEGLGVAQTTAAQLPKQRPMGLPNMSEPMGLPDVSDANVHRTASTQSTTRALDTSGELELLAALHHIQSTYNDASVVADALAELLDHEASMRGIEP